MPLWVSPFLLIAPSLPTLRGPSVKGRSWVRGEVTEAAGLELQVNPGVLQKNQKLRKPSPLSRETY